MHDLIDAQWVYDNTKDGKTFIQTFHKTDFNI